MRVKDFLATDAEIEQLPLYGKIQVSGGDKDHTFDLGTHFVGKVHQGRVTILNNSNESVSVEQLTSSCDCTLAQPSDDVIAAEQRQHLLIQIAKASVGSFSEKIDIQFAGRHHQTSRMRLH